MKRLTTDNPQNNIETLLNYAYAKDRRAILRHADGQNDVDLCEYIAKQAKKAGCDLTAEDVMEGACMECDCPLSLLYNVATQAAETRERLKRYEDIGLEPEGIAMALNRKMPNPKPLTIEELQKMSGEPVWVSGHGWRLCYGIAVVAGKPQMVTSPGVGIVLDGYGQKFVAYGSKPKED